MLNFPIEGCTYATRDIEAGQALARFTVHGCSRATGACQEAEFDKLSHPRVSKKARVKSGSTSLTGGTPTRPPHAQSTMMPLLAPWML